MLRKILIIALLFFVLLNIPVFSESNKLEKSWDYYKNTFISKDGRVIDSQKDSVTTSEGQSYAMLRALIMNDYPVFSTTYKWTKENILHKDDNLFAWLWGKKDDKTWEILDQNSASDSDIDIAFALILAADQWKNKTFLSDAKKILNDIWDKETIEINGLRILTSGKKQTLEENIPVNPSYFATYAFRVFNKYDKTHDWNKLVDSSYILANQVIDKTGSGLPPDWFYVNSKTGAITFDQNGTMSDFSYDAVRTFFRFYLDYEINGETRAKKLLSKIDFFLNNWKKDQKFYTNIKLNGQIRDNNESICSIAILLPVIKLYNRELAQKIFSDKVNILYKDNGFWGDSHDYYCQNLAWFGNWVYLDEKISSIFKKIKRRSN